MLHDDITQHVWSFLAPLWKLEQLPEREREDLFKKHFDTHSEKDDAAILRNVYTDFFIAMRKNPVPFYIEYPLIDSDDKVNGDALDQSLVETAREFFDAGILRLPYPSIMLIVELGNGTKLISIIEQIDEGEEYTGIRVIPLLAHSKQYAKPLATFAGIFTRNNAAFEYVPLCYRSAVGEDKVIYKRSVKTYATFALYCLLLMNMPHYKREEGTVPEKVNRNRVKAGKKPYSAWTRIFLDPRIQEALTKGGSGGHTVRPHWRRGHIRTRNGVPHAVRPTMVNWDGDDTLEKNVYQVQK